MTENAAKKHKNKHVSASIMKICGYISLIAAVAFFITAAYVNSWFAVGGGVGMLLFAILVGSAKILTFKNGITYVNGQNAPSTDHHATVVPPNEQPTKAEQQNISSSVKYNKNHYYNNPNLANNNIKL